MNLEFSGRNVVVTGGTGALGTAVVTELIRRGAMCHIPCRDESELKHFPFREHAQVNLTMSVELAEEPAAQRFYQSISSLWASIHVAGGFAMSPIAEICVADFRRMMDMNAQTCFLCCREAVKRIRASGGEGRIVNVAAKPALVPVGGMVAYSASKAAVASITQSLAEELAAERIWVNAVVPSIMDTPANRSAMPKADHAKWPKVDEVAATMVFLASPQNAATRGALVPVYGQS